MNLLRYPYELLNEEIEECIDDDNIEIVDMIDIVDMIRGIIFMEDVYGKRSTHLHDENFAIRFAYATERFINADRDTIEWDAAWNDNYDWALDIAENINNLL